MANQLDNLANYLSKNLIALRQSRNLTQGDLSKLAGLPRSTLTNLESGQSNPSLKNLALLAEALQVSIEELIAKPRAQCQLIKNAELNRKTYDSGRLAITKLLPESVRGFEIDRMEFMPNSLKQGVPHLIGTKEYLTVLEGAVSVYVAGENYLVEAGDVLAFPGDQAHSYRNAFAGKSLCISVVAVMPRQRSR